jgi:hypothetical protein
MFILMLIALDSMVGSDWRNHVQMMVMSCSIASGVDHSRLDSIKQLVVVVPLYLIEALVLYHMSYGTRKPYRKRFMGTDCTIFNVKTAICCPWNYALTTF